MYTNIYVYIGSIITIIEHVPVQVQSWKIKQNMKELVRADSIVHVIDIQVYNGSKHAEMADHIGTLTILR